MVCLADTLSPIRRIDSEQHPEFIQRVADGRLTQMQTDAGTGHVFFSQQRIEHYQQIQIDIAQ